MGEELSGLLNSYPGAPETTVVHWKNGSATLAEVTEAARDLAFELGGVRRAPVACIVDRGIDAVVGMFATWFAGGVYVPVNSRLPEAELQRQLTDIEPAALIVGGAHVRSVGGRRESHAVFPEDAALVMRTSGTTGAAKPVVLRHRAVLEGIDTVIARLRGSARGGAGSDERDRPAMPNLVPTSLALWAGIWNTLFAFRLGAPVVLLDRFDALDYATAVKRFGIRSTVLAPAMMSMLLTDPRIEDLKPLRLVRSVTAPLVPDQARRFHQKFGVDVLNSYGQTELGGEVVGWSAADLRRFGEAKLGAVGRPHSGISVRILDEEHREMPAGEVGEVFVHSPFATTLPPGRVVDGALRTGDLGRLDQDGFLWIEGRVSDMINRGGLKIVPQDVEAALRGHPQVADACVAGVPDERLGEVPVAWVIPEPAGAPGEPTERELRSFLRNRLAPYQVPVAIRLMKADFPRNEIGKVLRRELAAGYTPLHELEGDAR
ncbi:fatty acid--CoA ligase family protein [Actinospica sp.]|uniref:class I adenylate-forming enzyme family protein n=1 Tax=Actinospica sp. TaxID=1872142 RepID=UPI002CBA3815|nr:fatty acid--CoA ligase family protein [Actinospica sp.]HWG23299.1 fatty acid--CoA ligase family protein [Actinospica sp.]